MRISGGLLLFSVLTTIGFGLLYEDLGRSLYLLLGLVVAFGLSFMVFWVRMEITNSMLELLGYLGRETPGIN